MHYQSVDARMPYFLPDTSHDHTLPHPVADNKSMGSGITSISTMDLQILLLMHVFILPSNPAREFVVSANEMRAAAAFFLLLPYVPNLLPLPGVLTSVCSSW